MQPSNKDGQVVLITFNKLPKDFTNWMDQLYGDEWFFRVGSWIDQPSKQLIKVYVIRSVNAERFETAARIKFPELF